MLARIQTSFLKPQVGNSGHEKTDETWGVGQLVAGASWERKSIRRRCAS